MTIDARSWRIVAIGICVSLLALFAEWLAWRNRLIVGIPHLALGWAIIGAGLVAWVRVSWSRVGGMLVAAGMAWFISALGDGATDTGRLAASLAFLYLGLLLHTISTYPTGRLRDPFERALVGAGYLVSIAVPLWRSTWGLLVVGGLVGIGQVLLWRHRSVADRRDMAPAAYLGASVAVLLLVTPVARLAGSATARALEVAPWDIGTLITGTMSLVVALGLAWSLIQLDQRRAVMTDLVIELGEGRSTGLVAELRRVLGDPGLTIGMWRPATGRFDDEAGTPLVVAETNAPGVAIIEDQGERIAVVLHDPALAGDPGLRAALIQSARMAARNEALRHELGTRADQLAASRRRVLEAAEAQRRTLLERLRLGPATRLSLALAQVDQLLGTLSVVDPAHRTHLERAADHLSHARLELDGIGQGLDPGSVANRGITAALRDLAARNPVPVTTSLPGSLPLTGVAASTLYYTASEALANVTRHARASHAWLQVATASDHVALVVEDGGIGGADVSRGTGMRGLRDRLEALGGSLAVADRTAGGTRLVALLPSAAASAPVTGIMGEPHRDEPVAAP